MNSSTENEARSKIPKKIGEKRKLGTLNYIHKKLFKESHDSDIKIVACNRQWNLHKIILSQSPYFDSMFSVPWKEKTLKEINIAIEDVNITAEALHKVFESLYSGKIEIEPTEAVPVLACASFFQLDDLLNHCAEVMKSCISKDTAVRFLEVAEFYSMKEVENVSFDWLCRNINCSASACPQLLNMISEDLMTKLLSSPDLCVCGEFDVFLLLTAWVFLKENSSNFHDNGVQDSFLCNTFKYFKRYENEKPFLETDSGISYQSLFRAVRLENYILGLRGIEKWNVIPTEWFLPVYRTQWNQMSRIYCHFDEEPKSVTEEIFNKECVRIGDYIKHYREALRYDALEWYNSPMHCDFGLHFGFCYENGRFKIKRDMNSINSVGSSFSNKGKRYLMYRVSLFSEDSDGRVLSKAETDIKTVSMEPYEEIEVLTFRPAEHFPVRYRINILVPTP